MRKVSLSIGLGILFTLALIHSPLIASSVSAEAASLAQGRSSIYGTVYGDARRPVADVYVELLDDFNASIRQNKTDASGRFQFSGLVDGRYILKVHTGNTGYLEHTQQVVISAISSVVPSEGARSGGADNQHVDIALRLDERGMYGPFSTIPGVVFAQEIPPVAKRNYEEGIAYIREKKEEQAFAKFKAALEVFPDYYAALDRLGAEYAVRGVSEKGVTSPEYLQAGFVLLTKATQTNPRGYSSMYGLGWTEYHLGMTTEAIDHLGKAAAINGKSSDPYLFQGMAYRRAKMPDKAEEALKKADQLASGKSADIHWELANVYNSQKRYGEAADQMELYLKLAPKGKDPEKIKELIKRLREMAK